MNQQAKLQLFPKSATMRNHLGSHLAQPRNRVTITRCGGCGGLGRFQRHYPLVLHAVDDELYVARLCERLWSCAKATRLRKAVEAERAAS